MATFGIANLHLAAGNDKFKFENIKFQRLSRGIRIEDQWCNSYGATFKAVAGDRLIATPIIQDKGLIGVVDDLCLLLSLAQSRSIFCPVYEVGGNSVQKVSSKKGKIFDPKLIKDSNLVDYLTTATRTLRQPNWAERTGFVPAAYFWAETLNHEPGDIGMLLAWIALEVLANAYTLQHYSKSKARKISIRRKMAKMKNGYNWHFFKEDLISESRKVRDKIMHEGNYGSIDRGRMPEIFSKLLKTTQISLITLLGCESYINEEYTV
jgi:hypothetical protein